MIKKVALGISAFILLSTIAFGVAYAQAPPPPNPFDIPLTVERSADRLSSAAAWTPNTGAEYQGVFVVAKLFTNEPDTAGYGVKIDTFRYIDWPLAGDVGSLVITGLDPSRAYFYGVISTARDSSGNWVWSDWEIVQDAASAPPAQGTPTTTATPTIAELNKNVQGGVVQIITPDSSGSGFIIDSDGRVVTNQHVVESNQTVTVRMYGGTEYQASVLGVDAVADLAIVDINGGSNIQPVPLGDSDSVRVGEEVVAIGYPLGQQSQSITRGIISGLRPNHYGTDVDYLQTDAAINPGNSGGPLFNRAGQVIGVNTLREFVSSDGRPVDNIAFAVAINELKERLEALKSGQDVFVPRTEWRWDRWYNNDYDWSIRIPPGWNFDPDYVTWQNDDGSELVELYVHSNLSSDNIHGLDAYARWWKAEVESWGAENYPQSFRVTSFDKKADRGDRQFYSLEYENFNTARGCWEHWMDHIFADGNYGAVIEGGICRRNKVVTDEDWGDIPEILDSFELHHSEFADVYRNNLYGHSLDLGLHYYLSADSEKHDFSFFWGFKGSTRVAFLNVWSFEASEGNSYELQDLARWRRERASAYATEQGWPLFQVRSLTKYSETSPIDGVERQWYEFKYRRNDGANCVEDVTELIILEDSNARGKIAYVVHGAVCESHMDKWGPRRDAALDSFRP